MSVSWSIYPADSGAELLSAFDACDFAIGAFDGVHLGHAALIECLKEHAAEQGVPSVAVLFDPDPSAVLRPSARELALMPIADRIGALLSLGVDAVASIVFDSELAPMEYEAFIDSVLSKIAPVNALFVGEGFRMGAGGKGDVDALSELGAVRGFEVHGLPLLRLDGQDVSASRIRELISSGDIGGATRLLGRPYSVKGAVLHGRGEGTGLGFPTANIVLPAGLCTPAEGVYACWGRAGGRRYPSAVNVGSPRSFTASEHEEDTLVEAHLIGFCGDLYDQMLELAFIERIRPQESFASIAELQSAVSDNIEYVKARLTGDEEVDDDRR